VALRTSASVTYNVGIVLPLNLEQARDRGYVLLAKTIWDDVEIRIYQPPIRQAHFFISAKAPDHTVEFCHGVLDGETSLQTFERIRLTVSRIFLSFAVSDYVQFREDGRNVS
jgi:hypothetical protein